MIQISLCRYNNIYSNDISLIYQSVFTGTCVTNTCGIKICNSLFVDFYNSKKFFKFLSFLGSTSTTTTLRTTTTTSTTTSALMLSTSMKIIFKGFLFSEL